jgi:hypothetical protein
VSQAVEGSGFTESIAPWDVLRKGEETRLELPVGDADRPASGETSATTLPGPADPGIVAVPQQATDSGISPPAEDEKKPVSPVGASVVSLDSTDKRDKSPAPVGERKARALSFRGSDRVEIANSRDLIELGRPFTVELWLRFAPGDRAHWLCGDRTLRSKEAGLASGSAVGWQLVIQQTMNGRHRLAASTRAGYGGDFAAAAGKWHHLAYCADAKTVNLFADGRRLATGTVERLLTDYAPSSAWFCIGSREELLASSPPGLIGDLRGFRVSSVCRYQTAFTPELMWAPDDATEVLLDFDTGHDITLPDLSGKGRSGRIYGARWLGIDEPGPGLRTIAAASAKAVSSKSAPEPTPAATPLVGLAKKAMIPDDRELQQAREKLRAVFQNEWQAAKEPRQLVELADKLLELAADTNERPAARYAMIDEAQKLAAQGGDLRKALSIIDDLSRQFDVNLPVLKASAVELSSEAARSIADRRRIAESATQVAEEMVEAGRFDLAGEVIQVAVVQAGRAKDAELGKLAREIRDDVALSKRFWNGAQEARDQLASDPDRADLHLRYGRFLCFRQRNWELGLPHLAKGSHPELAAIARLELEEPASAERQMALGTAWAEAATSVDAHERAPVLLRGRDWLRKAESQLAGLTRAEVEKRIKEIDADLPVRFRTRSAKPIVSVRQPPREFLGLLGRIQSEGVDASVLWKYETGLRITDQTVSEILVQAGVPRGRLRLEFVGLLHVPQSMTVNITHSGGSSSGTFSLWIDQKLIGETGGTRATSDVYKLDLNAGEHSVRWVITGGNLGSGVLLAASAASGERLPVYHTPELLAAVRETPFRPRLNVNLIRSP